MNKVVYVHRKKSNGEIYYVGMGSRKRALHKHRKNKHWRNITDKHGCEVDILYEGLTTEDAYELEEFIIETIGLDNLTNRTSGGDGCRPSHLFESGWDTWNELVSNGDKQHPSIGTKWSAERRAQTMKNRTNNRSVNFRGVNYYSLREAERLTGISRYLIRKEVDAHERKTI